MSGLEGGQAIIPSGVLPLLGNGNGNGESKGNGV